MTPRGLFRLICLMLAWTDYAANGAQAHIQGSGTGMVAIPDCTADGTEILEISVGSEAPPIATETCCGDCFAARPIRFGDRVGSALRPGLRGFDRRLIPAAGSRVDAVLHWRA
ncbi:MAG: hypothetical protein AAGJ84_09960 [Pseudomonadota bacterium]